MEGRKRESGQCRSRLVLPPNTGVSPGEAAHVVLIAGRPKGPVDTRPGRCVECQREFEYLKRPYQDGKCEGCHNAPASVKKARCTCGIEIAKASMCSESDCPYR